MLLKWIFNQIFKQLDRIEATLRRIENKETYLMAQFADFQVQFDRFDTGLTALVAEIQALKDRLAAGGMTAAEEDAALSTLTTKIGQLEAVTAGINAPPA